MFDHGMSGKAELSRDAHAFVARRDAGKGDAAFHHGALDSIETPEKIKVPPGAAALAVGRRLQADFLLLLDGALDLTVLDFLERRPRDLPLRAPLARLFQRRRPQQAADVVGAERRLGALHRLSSTLRCHARASGHRYSPQ